MERQGLDIVLLSPGMDGATTIGVALRQNGASSGPGISAQPQVCQLEASGQLLDQVIHQRL